MPPLTEFRFRIRDANDTTDVVSFTSVRGGTGPYLKEPPKGDGASFDPTSGKSVVAAYTGTIVDWPIGSMQRALTAQLEDTNGRQQLGYRRAFVEYRQDGGTWNVLVAGVLTLLRLTDALTWEYTVNDATRSQSGTQAFTAAPATTIVSLLSQYTTGNLARGCLFGGPFWGNFALGATFRDLGGWRMRVSRVGTAPNYNYFLEPVMVYGPPNFITGPRPRLTDFSDAINQGAATLYQNNAPVLHGAPFTTIADSQEQTFWNGLVYVINDGVNTGDGVSGWVPYRPTWGAAFDSGLYNANNPNQLVGDMPRKLGIFCAGDGQAHPLTPGAVVSVKCLTVLPTDLSPIYFDGHPIDLFTTLWTTAGIPFDATAATAAKATIGNGLRIALRITGAQDIATLVEQVAFPFGIGLRANDLGQLVPFRTRVMANTPPSTTITSADVVQGSTGLPFELDTASGFAHVVVQHKSLQPVTVVGGSTNTLDGVVETDVTASFDNGDTTGLPFGTLQIDVPGMIHHDGMLQPLDLTSLTPIAAEFFDRFGHGPIALETTFKRGGAGAPLDADGAFATRPQLGDEVLVQLPQLPNHNYRLGDNNAISARAMQIVRVTELPSGRVVRLLDSGPNAQPLPTVPTVSIAAVPDHPRTGAQFTITNAAALNALGYAVRVQWAVNAGATPAAADYVPVAYFAAGAIPTGAQLLPPAQAGKTVWVHARSEKAGARPSNYGTAASVALSHVIDPNTLTALTDASDGSRHTISWTPGSGTAGDLIDIWLRLSGQSFASASRVMTLSPGSTTYTLEGLTPGTAYIASVQYRDPRTDDVSAPIDIAFTAGPTVATLDAPSDPNGFSGSQDPRYGFPRNDGQYGLAVAATEFPGFTEFVEEVETAPNAGTYGAPVTVAIIPNVQGDWTLFEKIAPNDGLRRALSARHVRDGANFSGYTDAVIVTPWTAQPLGLFSQTAGANGIIRVSATESSDGTARVFTVLVGRLVDTLFVHHRTVPIDETGDAFDFSGDETVSESGELLILRAPSDGSGTITFSIPHPLREFKVAGRLVPRTAPPHLKDGESVVIEVDAAPPAISGAIHATRSGALATLSLSVNFGISDGPVQVALFADSISGSSTVLSTTLAAPATITSSSHPELANIVLPAGKDSILFRLVITDNSGQDWPVSEANVHRDPTTDATATLLNYRSAPTAVIVFGPDTDAVHVTCHDGKVKTFSGGALASSPIFYTVGTTARDDASLETLLVVDETRSGFKIDAVGGGTTTTILGPVDLHGQPSNPPTADIRKDANATGDAMDVRITPDTQVDEKLHVYWRDGGTNGAIEWIACVSAGDPTALQVTAGTQLGPSNFFRRVDGIGSPAAKLSAVPLTRDQVAHYGVMIEGVDSGIQSPWLDVTLSLLAQPWNEHFGLEWDDANGCINAIVAAGAHTQFETVQISTSALFTSPTTQTLAMADGTVNKFTFALSQAQRGKQWYGRAKPNNNNTGTGLDGVWSTASVAVPALFDVQPSTAETVTAGTLTLVVSDPGSVLDPTWTNGTITGAFHAEVLRLGVKTVEAMTSIPGGGATTGTYTKAITLIDHTVTVNVYAHLKDGSVRYIGTWPFDSDKIADLKDSNVVDNGANADVTLNWDTDSKVGVGTARYSLNAGSTWTTVDITSVLVSQFSIARTGSTQQLLVQAQNAIDSNWGNQSTIKVSAFTAGSSTAVPQGEVNVDFAGFWQAVGGGPSNAVSYKYQTSTSSQPTAAAVAAGPSSIITGGPIFSFTGGPVSIGQPIYVTLVAYDGASGSGTNLGPVYLYGRHQNASTSKFDTFAGASLVLRDPAITGITVDTATGKLVATAGQNPTKAQCGASLRLSSGLTITELDMYANFNYSGSGTERTLVTILGLSKSTGSLVFSATAETDSASGSIQFVQTTGLSHVVDTQNNMYFARAQMSDSSGTVSTQEIVNFTIGYTQNSLNQGL